MIRKILRAEMDPELVSKEIGAFVIDKVTSLGLTGCVIGLSGGVDSTATAGLIKKAFDWYNSNHGDNLELVGYILPSKTNDQADEDDGVKVAKQLGIRYEVRNIEKVVESYRTTNPECFKSDFDKGNLTARIRANILSTKAATERKILSGTGNRDEDYGLGYYTLFGDGAVHMSPIGNLPKRLVKQMAHYLGFPDIAGREPTAGLELGQTDFKDLGYSYETAEIVMNGIGQGFTPDELVTHEEVEAFAQRDIAMQSEPKYGNTKDIVDDIIRRHKIALGKMTIVHPPAAPVTLEYKEIR